MISDWMTSPNAALVLAHAGDARPAWLFAQDGRLLWRNRASAYFLARIGAEEVRPAPPARPIGGQVARVLRLGAPGRASLSRIRFLAGDRPGAATCACTPLAWEDGQIALLIVGVDAIAADVLASGAADFGMDAGLWAGGALGTAGGGNGGPAEREGMEPAAHEDLAGHEGAALTERGDAELAGETEAEAGGGASGELGAETGGETPEEPEEIGGKAEDASPAGIAGGTAEAGAPARLTSLMDRLMTETQIFSPLEEREEDDARGDADEESVEGLTASVETGEPAGEAGKSSDEADEGPGETVAGGSAVVPEERDWAEDADVNAPGGRMSPGLFRVIGRYLRRAPDPGAQARAGDDEAPGGAGRRAGDMARSEDVAARDVGGRDETRAEPEELAELWAGEIGAGDEAPRGRAEEREAGGAREKDVLSGEVIAPGRGPIGVRDREAVERVSRYNFDELSRILTDRVGEKAGAGNEARGEAPPGSILGRGAAGFGAGAASTGALINLGGETLVLNRLPLGILVFRDQAVLFANRAITEMTGYGTVEGLRAAGLAAIFPGADAGEAGPINHLMQRDGTLVPVTARLQSISWQGQPALMLSASATEVRTGHEGAVRAFARAFADMGGEGFFETGRSGAISAIEARAVTALGGARPAAPGRPLADFLAPEDVGAFEAFLKRPGRFAETERPSVRLRGAAEGVEVTLFAQGQAGAVGGYFGFVHQRTRTGAPRLAGPAQDSEAGVLARVSRGVRRPLNTIIGFSDLIGSEAFGPIETQRYLDYARDIRSAGEEIAGLVDELDDYTRLREGRYLAQRASIDLMGLLESCVLRMRPQAARRRVLMRNAISETLPRVIADRASLAQAVLNLLASAIDQTPSGGTVVISAQTDEAGGIAIHVRDNSRNGTDLSERFVVFREGTGEDGQALAPVRSSVGLALTRSLLAVNAFSLSVDPAGSQGMLFTLVIPAEMVEGARAEKNSDPGQK